MGADGGQGFTNRVIVGDALDVLRRLPDGIAGTCVTSPPYWALRDYGVPGQIGLEPLMDEYVAKLVAVFREVRRVLMPGRTSGSFSATPTSAGRVAAGAPESRRRTPAPADYFRQGHVRPQG